jgi:hypothetical protein
VLDPDHTAGRSCTIWTARAPDAVGTFRMNEATRQATNHRISHPETQPATPTPQVTAPRPVTTSKGGTSQVGVLCQAGLDRDESKGAALVCSQGQQPPSCDARQGELGKRRALVVVEALVIQGGLANVEHAVGLEPRSRRLVSKDVRHCSRRNLTALLFEDAL